MCQCIECGKEIKKSRKWQRFCSQKCRYKNWDKENPRVKKVGICK